MSAVHRGFVSMVAMSALIGLVNLPSSADEKEDAKSPSIPSATT